MGKRKLVAMQAEIDNLQSQVENLSNIVAGLSQDHIPAPRILDQSIFDHKFFDDVYYWQPIETESLYEAMHMQLQIGEVGI